MFLSNTLSCYGKIGDMINIDLINNVNFISYFILKVLQY